jgi:hypothetical protein
MFIFDRCLDSNPDRCRSSYIAGALPELEFLINLWGKEPSRNRVIVPARQAT